MEAAAGESDSKGKAVVASSPSLAEPEFKCPRCSKAFHSAPALCGHQNAHRLVKEPTKISPVLAAVLNNPLPPDDKPKLIMPPRPKAGGGAKVNPSKQQQQQAGAGASGSLSPRHHPYRRLGKEPVKDNTSNNNNNINNPITVSETSSCASSDTNKKPEGGVGGDEDEVEIIQNNADAQYYPFEREVAIVYREERYSLPLSLSTSLPPSQPAECSPVTLDLLGEWMPISGFGDHGNRHRHHDAAVSRIDMDGAEAAAAGLEIGSKTTSTATGHLDLELKLGL